MMEVETKDEVLLGTSLLVQNTYLKVRQKEASSPFEGRRILT
jgi:hypothetical protein